MADLKVKEIREALVAEGLPQEKIDAALARFLQEVKPETVHLAVVFLGAATLILAAGSVYLAACGKTVPEALWTALGACVGGLAGIYIGKR